MANELQIFDVGQEHPDGLFQITIQNDQPAVSARELHEFLEVGADYRHWFPRMCEYGFTEGQDFNTVKIDRVQQEGNRMVTRTVDDAAITIDMAKELCMLQRSEKGKIARRYFLQLEKDWNSPEKLIARALLMADKKIKVLESKIAENAPLVEFAGAVSGSENAITVEKFAKIVYDRSGIQMGRNQMMKWLRLNGYLTEKNLPYQKWLNAGYFEVCEVVKFGKVYPVTLITGIGQQKIFQHLTNAA